MTKIEPKPKQRKGILEGDKVPLKDAEGRRYWRGRVRLLDGTLARVPIPEPKCYSRTASRDHVDWCQEDEDTHHTIFNARTTAKAASAPPPAERGELVEDWFKRYVGVLRGLDTKEKYCREMLASWASWLGPFFAGKGMLEITADDVRAARDNLMRAWHEGEIGASRAMNLWLLITTPFSRAFTNDNSTVGLGAVRVAPASSNPALNVKPPVTQADKDEDARDRQACSPALFLALMNCAARPLEDRRWDAVMAYSGLSPSEFFGLRKSDIRVDAERPHFLVQRGRDMKEGNATTTKQKQRNRKAPIHPEIRPLLRLILEDVHDAGDYVFRRLRSPDVERVRDVEARVEELREHLKIVGAEPEFIEGTDTLKPFDVRSWRTTFATWAWSAGYDSVWVDVWLGHKPKTTAAKHYAKDVPHFEDVVLKAPRPGVVPPFPPLPAVLLEEGDLIHPAIQAAAKYAEGLCEGRELNPYRSYPTGT